MLLANQFVSVCAGEVESNSQVRRNSNNTYYTIVVASSSYSPIITKYSWPTNLKDPAHAADRNDSEEEDTGLLIFRNYFCKGIWVTLGFNFGLAQKQSSRPSSLMRNIFASKCLTHYALGRPASPAPCPTSALHHYSLPHLRDLFLQTHR